VLGHYRASLQDQDALDMASPVADIERLLLEQLTVLRMPSMSLSACSTDSSAASNGSVSGCTAGGLAEISSTCTSRGNSADMSLSASFRTNSWFSSCGLLVREPSTESARSTSCSEQQHQPDQPVAPEHDPFMLARLLFEQPCDPSASHLTMAELRAKFADDVKQLQACLKQLEANTPPNGAPAQAVAAPAESCSHAGAGAGASGSNSGDWVTCAVQDARQQQQQDLSPLEAVWDVQLGMYVLTNSLLGAGRESMFFELQLTNWHTGERLQEPCRERHRAALQELQLTPAQLQRMAAGWKFFQPLMAPIISERKQLHAEGVQVHQLAAAGSGLQPSSASPALSIHSGHGAGLQAQQEQASRLRMLARKDALLRGIMALYMQGCLSLLQQAKLRVAMVSGARQASTPPGIADAVRHHVQGRCSA
jgi:hypothetical protein